ncbi:MAG: NAD(P)/FAD-dependent oxidoreductase [Gemmataceae bacterium]|nr:NAD(P)/FAD-dependent oxidoreductase [Gemmataceae bacterium]
MSEALWDLVVVGAGAAGLVAATRAAERGRRTLLLEKNRRAGVKILMSGGTRCNITHATDNRGIVAAFGPPGRFLHSALAALGVDETLAMFEGEGVATKVEETGKIFPVSDKASDVLGALLRRLERSGAVLSLGEPVQNLRPGGDGFQVTTAKRVVGASQVILTSGGQSYPGSGTTGDGYGFVETLGHTVVKPVPALVPVTVDAAWVAGLRGITVPDAKLQVREATQPLIARRGSLLIAHFGLSGPVALDVSRVVSRHAQPRLLTLEIDWLPSVEGTVLDEFLRGEALASGKKQLAGILATHLPRRLCDTLTTLAGMPADRRATGLSKGERARLVECVKRLPVPITGTLGFGRAEVTAGGVALDEVDSRTMRSKKVPNLFIAGELLDLDGPIGGYNFQAAFSTGWLAGDSV